MKVEFQDHNLHKKPFQNRTTFIFRNHKRNTSKVKKIAFGVFPLMLCPCFVSGCLCFVPGCPCFVPGCPCFVPAVPVLSLAAPILSLCFVCVGQDDSVATLCSPRLAMLEVGSQLQIPGLAGIKGRIGAH